MLKSNWNNLTLRTRIAGGVIVLVVFISLILLAIFSGSDYHPLYTNLDLNDAAAITQTLADNGIAYRLSDNGSSILVPEDVVYQTRLTLAAQGLPAGGIVGFETFNTTRLGETEAERQLRYQNALQGELTRTLRELNEVENARVHLVIAPRSLFIQDSQPSTAAVLLTLRPGASLSSEQVRGITHLLSTSVERLAPENVTVLDTRGNVLNSFHSSANLNGDIVSQRLELQNTYGEQLATNVRTMLERIYGYGKVVSSVNVELDFDTIEQYEETYAAPTRDGGLMRSSQLYTEVLFEDGTSGIPGVASNIPGYVEVDPDESGVYRHESIINYELDRFETHQSIPPGGVKNISVSIWIDGDLSQSELDTIQTSVSGALGMKLERGDYIAVASVPFQSDFSFVTSDEIFPDTAGFNWLYILVVVFLVLLVLGLLIRYLVLSKKEVESSLGIELAATEDDEAGVPLSLEEQEKLNVIKRIRSYTQDRPQDFAHMIKTWLIDE